MAMLRLQMLVPTISHIINQSMINFSV